MVRECTSGQMGASTMASISAIRSMDGEFSRGEMGADTKGLG
jgi:hypothetical protein